MPFILTALALAYAPTLHLPFNQRCSTPAMAIGGSPNLENFLQPPTAEEAEETPDATGEEPPLSTPARVKRALTFYSKVVPILAAYKAAEVGAEVTKTSLL